MKILFVTSRAPYPLDKGDKLRAYHFIKELSKNNQVILFSLNDSKLSDLENTKLHEIAGKVYIYKLGKLKIFWNLLIALFKGLPFQVGYFFSTSAKRELEILVALHKPDVVISQLVRTSEYCKDLKIDSKYIDLMDALSKGIERRIPHENFIFKLVLKLELKRLQKYEEKIAKYFNQSLIITQQDLELLSPRLHASCRVVANGVDSDFFRNSLPNNSPEYDILFAGNMAYPPNVFAVVFLVEQVLPILEKENKHIKVLIAGANPSDEVLKLQRHNVTVTGWMDDIRQAYFNSKIFVAPMFIGTGLQNKILESMSMQLPCVTSSLAAQALVDSYEKILFICNTPNEFAECISKLLIDPEQRNRVGELGRNYVLENYSWQKVGKELNELVNTKSW